MPVNSNRPRNTARTIANINIPRQITWRIVLYAVQFCLLSDEIWLSVRPNLFSTRIPYCSKLTMQFILIYVHANLHRKLSYIVVSLQHLYFKNKTSSAHSSTINASESLSGSSLIKKLVQNVFRLVFVVRFPEEKANFFSLSS